VSKNVDLVPVRTFLGTPTPLAWVAAAQDPGNLPLLLIDHANCERKAAESALATMKRYGAGVTQARSAAGGRRTTSHQIALLNKMSKLAREELRHFEQVLALMHKRDIGFERLGASRYAAGLRSVARTQEPGRLVDTLLIGGIIEARSCERFAVLAPLLDDELSAFYQSLLKSESRHFKDYLVLAESLAGKSEVDARLQDLLAKEACLILEPDSEFRFHSGPPQAP